MESETRRSAKPGNAPCGNGGCLAAGAAYSFAIAMKRTELLDLYFMENRAKLIDIAAFMDRMDRGEGDAQERADFAQRALRVWRAAQGGAVERIHQPGLFAQAVLGEGDGQQGRGAVAAVPGEVRSCEQGVGPDFVDRVSFFYATC